MEVVDIGVQAITISWTPVTTLNVTQVYSLTVNYGSHTNVTTLKEFSYNFTAPEGAHPCEIYNFSVIATYEIVGTTYTGAGCSMNSPVLSRMLPSLPNIKGLNSSLTYSLVMTAGKFKLNVSFEVISLHNIILAIKNNNLIFMS